jgi:hypothetical protein
MPVLWVNGVVSTRDHQPYVQLSNEERIFAQLDMAEARSFAMDIFQMCARTEADAMIRKFFDHNDYPSGVSDALMMAFRDYRAELDQVAVERRASDPGEPSGDGL